MRGLKIDIGRTTVANILVEAGLEPAPERIRKRTWKHFMRSHWETLYACDFFAVESLGVFGTVRYMSSQNTARKLPVRKYVERYGTLSK